jgi:hypothetical protein
MGRESRWDSRHVDYNYQSLIGPMTVGAAMAYERRLEAVVLGPGRPGRVKVTLGRGRQQFVADVPVELLHPSLRMPNSEFVAVVSRRNLVRVEPAGHVWLTIQDSIRSVLNSDWDPIGVSNAVADEYDMYIGHIHSLLAKKASEQDIAKYLLGVELERMGLTGTPMKQLLLVAKNLRNLDLPPLGNPEPPR